MARKDDAQKERDAAREQLRFVGGQDMPVGYDEVDEAIDAFELSVLRLVLANASIGGNSVDYTLHRISELKKR
jgi:hypothetical protein